MKLYLIILALLCMQQVAAQIEFFHGTLEETLEKAKTEKKAVFVDVYAKWCGPCKQMAATTFVDSTVSNFFNENFVSLKLDGETEHGRTIMQKYQITAYPTLLYFDVDGNFVKKDVGGQSVESLMKSGKLAQNPATDPSNLALTAFAKSKKKKKDLGNLILVLAKEKNDSLSVYCTKYYAQNMKLSLTDPVELEVFMAVINNYDLEITKEYFANATLYATDKVAQKAGLVLQETFLKSIKNKDFSIFETQLNELWPALTQQTQFYQNYDLVGFTAAIKQSFDQQTK